jgi:protein import protein ZIM17
MLHDCGGKIPGRCTIRNPRFGYRSNFAGYQPQPLQRTFVSDATKKDGNSVDPSVHDTTSDEIQIPGALQGGRKLAIIFTCVHCNTRSAKQFTERSYRHGVVIATCPGCKRRHLIADNLGYFSDEDGGWDIEKGMAKLGENVRVATNDDVFELTVEDIYTKEVIEAAIENATSDSKVTSTDNSKNS